MDIGCLDGEGKNLLHVIQQLDIQYKGNYTKKGMERIIRQRLLRNPELTGCDKRTLFILKSLNWDIVDSKGVNYKVV